MQNFKAVLSTAVVAVGSFAGAAYARENIVVRASSTTYSSADQYSSNACEEDHLKDNAIQLCREAGYDAVPEQLPESEIKREHRLLDVHSDDDLALIREGWYSMCRMTGLYRCQNQSDVDERIALDNRTFCYINAYSSGFRGKKTAYEVRSRKGSGFYSNVLLKGKFKDVESALNYLNTIAPKLGCVIDKTIK
ncbi:MAG: hypothetical protein ABIR96_12145 [Bdellovibrionota bacterium]